MTHILPLWAEAALRTRFEWGPHIQSNSDWILPIAATAVVLLFVRAMYRRDAAELRRPWGLVLTALRTTAFLGLLLLYLQPHWRIEREEVRNSRAVLLVDTSLSMGLSDTDGDKTSNAAGDAPSRAQQIAAALTDTDFLTSLRKTHDVTVLEFSDDLKREQAVTLGKLPTDVPVDLSSESPATKEPVIDWAKLLHPTGTETRLGQALRQLIQDERGTPVSGIIVLSDGGQNAGIAPDGAIEAAREAKIPIFSVGLGSARQPTNVAISDLAVPARAYPGDHYTVTAYLQSQGLAGKLVTVQVFSRAATNSTASRSNRTRKVSNSSDAGELLQSQQVTLGGEGDVVPVKFDLVSNAPGRRTLCVRIQTPAQDRNPADNSREADIEIVDRKNRVLLVADGPTREYQFLRNQLFRDRYTTVDVLLQSGRPGMSQEAKSILDRFPATRQAMWDYDCVVAFDPNWSEIGAARAQLLEKWVAEQGGGLILVAGPVNGCKGVGGWLNDPSMNAVRNLYPVEFAGRLVAAETSVYATQEPWPLEFTREGSQSDFLWLGDTAVASTEVWSRFPGVFSCQPVRGPKPGAAVYARFSDPRAAQTGLQQPVYFAGQFYGSGSVFYMGSGEMWRLRSLGENYFEQFYTKLIRHVSQGRLLRGSSRGVLLVGQDHYVLGSTVEVRAQLSNLRLEPLERRSVNLQVVGPDGSAQTVALAADASRTGSYRGQFTAQLEGTYRLELPIPESDERLNRRIQIEIPNLERTNTRRNDPLLTQIATMTGGRHYTGMPAAVATSGVSHPLAAQLPDRTSTVILPITPNPHSDEIWLRWMMIGICGLLCSEWLIRRLLKLA
ncbi:MAG: VWA domain-containing protein [Thermoguttaceae bacterium]